MKRISNPLRLSKRATRNILMLVLLMIILSIIMLIYSVTSDKKSSLKYKSQGSDKLSGQVHRRFRIESSEENIYNIGQYQVNLSDNRFLILDLSVKSSQETFDHLQARNILVQNAVLEVFSTYGSIRMPNTSAGKKEIKEKIRKNINTSLDEPFIQEVYFNSFIIQ